MKTILIVLTGGALGFALSVAFWLSGVGHSSHTTSNLGSIAACADKEAPAPRSRDFVPDLQALRDESKDLKTSLAALKTELSDLRAQLRAAKDRPDSPREREKTPSHALATPEAEAAWLRLMLREIRPKAYEEATEIVEKRFVPALKKYYLDRKTCVGADLESLMPSNLGKTLWRWSDFSFTVTNVNEAEIQLDADPELPKLSATIRFGEEVKTLDDRKEMVGWNKLPHWQEEDPLPRGEARVSTARASLGALKDRVRVFYVRKNVLPKSMADLDVSDAELQSDDFNASDYSFSGTEEAFVITCRAVFKDDPYDLTVTVNLKTGEASFNR
jgi:hypothetical protein